MTHTLPKIPGYKVVTSVGQGTFGTVYQVSRGSGKNKHFYAAKVYHRTVGSSPLDDPSIRDLFKEFEISKQWEHPNLVRAHEFGRVKLGSESHPYLIMDWVEGTSLDQCNIPMAFGEALDIILDAAYGLAQAAREHKSNATPVIHRDIKPANIILRSSPDSVAVVVDFGLARLLTPEWRQDSIRAPGSVSYCSPHQYDHANEANQGDDIYSLGCVFYYLLCGEHAYRIDPSTDGTVGSLRKLVDARAHKPLDKLTTDVPPEIIALVEKMMDCGADDGHRCFKTWDSFFEEAMLLLQYCRRRKANVLYLKGLGELCISEYQALFHRIYSQLNSTRSTEQILLRLLSSAGHLADLLRNADSAIGTERFSELREELASVFVWLMGLANHTGISLEPNIWLKYPGVCTYCHRKHTDQTIADRCKSQPRPLRPPGMLRLAQRGLDERPKTMLGWERLFADVYPLTFRKGWSFLIEQLLEEVGEIADAVTRPRRRLDWLRDHRVDPLAFEMSDLFAWICHCSYYVRQLEDGHSSAVADEIARQYHNEVCRNCRRAPCTCDPERSSRHTRAIIISDAASQTRDESDAQAPT